jgi:DNA-binding CsgD family transcriptional regulator
VAFPQSPFSLSRGWQLTPALEYRAQRREMSHKTRQTKRAIRKHQRKKQAAERFLDGLTEPAATRATRSGQRRRRRTPIVRPSYRPRCTECGGTMGKGRRSDGTCRACVLAAAAARRQRILTLAAEGATSRQIAEQFGIAPSTVRVELSRTRCLHDRSPRHA